ncbi:MAG: glycosyltransferase family 4 protein [Pyrinomonadaceae bacterium]
MNQTGLQNKSAAIPARVRVLIVAPSLGILGGQAVQAARLMERLKQESALDVGFLPVNPQLPGPFSHLQSVKYLRTVVTEVAYLISLAARIPRFDVIHIFSASYTSFILAPAPAVLISRLFGKKSILNYRSGEAEDHLTHWPGTTLPVLRRVDEIVVPSGYLVDVFGRFGFRVRSVFNFVDTTRFRFRERAPLRPVFFSNRNFESHYNVACVLRAFAIIQKTFPEAELTIAGDGKQRSQLESLATQLDLRKVKFVGLVPQEKMAELYDGADIFLNCPNIDNMPGSIIEAFASGLPVVTTEAGGIPYIVTNGHNGLLVSCGDYEGVAGAALRLLEDPALTALITRTAYRECEKYDWESVRDEWLKLYFELAKDRAVRGRLIEKPGTE